MFVIPANAGIHGRMVQLARDVYCLGNVRPWIPDQVGDDNGVAVARRSKKTAVLQTPRYGMGFA
jgi:hypothetical protein